jgi:hypothetical protein
VELYAEQGAEYQKLNEHLWDKVLQGFAVMNQDHPFTSVRTHEILCWTKTDHFSQMLANMHAEASARRCPNCGRVLKDDWRFCQGCGRAVA